MKKVFVMLMILALIVGVFGGCASKAQTASSEEQTQDFSNAVFPQVEKPEFSYDRYRREAAGRSRSESPSLDVRTIRGGTTSGKVPVWRESILKTSIAK